MIRKKELLRRRLGAGGAEPSPFGSGRTLKVFAGIIVLRGNPLKEGQGWTFGDVVRRHLQKAACAVGDWSIPSYDWNGYQRLAAGNLAETNRAVLAEHPTRLPTALFHTPP